VRWEVRLEVARLGALHLLRGVLLGGLGGQSGGVAGYMADVMATGLLRRMRKDIDFQEIQKVS